MVHTVTTLFTLMDEHIKEIQGLNHIVKDIQNDVKGIQAQMAEIQKTQYDCRQIASTRIF